MADDDSGPTAGDHSRTVTVSVPADLAEWWDGLSVHDPWQEGDPAGRLRHLFVVERFWKNGP